MAKQKVFTRDNIHEFLNDEHTHYIAQGERKVGIHEVEFQYVNDLTEGEKLSIKVDGEMIYRQTAQNPHDMLNGITKALKVINDKVANILY